jgi:hypothetical protein
MGVTRLPKFAATVSITTVKISLFSLCPLISIIVKGTKVISATSFVISMDVKKHTAHSAAPGCACFLYACHYVGKPVEEALLSQTRHYRHQAEKQGKHRQLR